MLKVIFSRNIVWGVLLALLLSFSVNAGDILQWVFSKYFRWDRL